MCGRYFIEIDSAEMQDIIKTVERNLRNTEALAHMKTGEIFPTNIVPVQTEDTYTIMKWGFTKFDGKGQIINARSETAFEKPMFRKSLLERRCIIPASYYFEWENNGNRKIKHAFRLPEVDVLYLAGIYRVESGADLPTFVILTKGAAPHVAHIHDRMPVIIPQKHTRDWLYDSPNAMYEAVEDVLFSAVV